MALTTTSRRKRSKTSVMRMSKMRFPGLSGMFSKVKMFPAKRAKPNAIPRRILNLGPRTTGFKVWRRLVQNGLFGFSKSVKLKVVRVVLPDVLFPELLFPELLLPALSLWGQSDKGTPEDPSREALTCSVVPPPPLQSLVTPGRGAAAAAGGAAAAGDGEGETREEARAEWAPSASILLEKPKSLTACSHTLASPSVAALAASAFCAPLALPQS
mmetsp:Transcript_133766/g.333843  ORF Transcript_133766/g.333843 Transcript_133766/m.333843 type:complete len:214 (+) Transcript_133766:2291-2932(+)